MGNSKNKMRHNAGIPKKTVKSNWQRYITTHFHLPFFAARRRSLRNSKSLQKGKRPLYLLRPSVRCLTNKYDSRLRLGKGFTLLEIKTAGLTLQFCYDFGIKVDKRRKDQNEETLKRNVERLMEYKKRLVVKDNKNNKEDSEEYRSCEQIRDKEIIPISYG